MSLKTEFEKIVHDAEVATHYAFDEAEIAAKTAIERVRDDTHIFVHHKGLWALSVFAFILGMIFEKVIF